MGVCPGKELSNDSLSLCPLPAITSNIYGNFVVDLQRASKGSERGVSSFKSVFYFPQTLLVRKRGYSFFSCALSASDILFTGHEFVSKQWFSECVHKK